MNILRGYSLIKWYAHIAVILLLLGFLSLLPVKAAGLVGTQASGSVGYTYRTSSYSTGSSDSQQLLRANMSNRFFIWRDWFIVGNSDLSFTQEQTSIASGENESTSATGSVGFTVLPQSSTPFGLSYIRSDSRVNVNFNKVYDQNTPSLDDSVVSESLVMHQSLIGKRYRLKLKFTDNQSSSVLRGKYGSNALSLSGLLREKTGILRASMAQKNEVTYDGLDRETQNLRFNHSYTGFKQTTINTSASTSKIQQSPKPGLSTAARYGVELAQAATTVTWRGFDKKVSVTSGLRFSGIKNITSRALQDSSNSTLSASLGVNYRFTQKLLFFVNSIRSQSGLSGEQRTSASDQFGVTYRSGEIKLNDWSYDWRANAKLGQRADDDIKSSTSSFGVGHGIARRWGFTRSQHVFLNGSQDFSSDTQSNQVRQRLSHRASLGWKQSLFNVNRRAQVQVSDQRDLEGGSVLQALTAELSQQTSLTRRMKLNGSLNYQLTSYQVTGGGSVASASNSSVISTNATFSYQSPFSISGMVFTSNYRYSQSVALQDTLSVRQALNNKLNYRVGKIDVSLQYLYREAREISYNTVYFNVKRVF